MAAMPPDTKLCETWNIVPEVSLIAKKRDIRRLFSIEAISAI
jgi:hypothetical protein